MAKSGDPRDGETAESAATGPVSDSGTKTATDSLDWESRFKYLLADFDNFRRRTERDRTGIRTEAEASLLRRLIPLVEGFQSAAAAGKTLPPTDPLRQGLELLGRELDAVLRSVGFVPVARVGDPFRHEEHEAVGEVVGAKNVSDGSVAEIVQQGYRFQGGLLRPAKVLVARAVPGPEPSPAPSSEPEAKEPVPPVVEEGSD
jgi:molecular chaperone GrpE